LILSSNHVKWSYERMNQTILKCESHLEFFLMKIVRLKDGEQIRSISFIVDFSIHLILYLKDGRMILKDDRFDLSMAFPYLGDIAKR
jgi:hypothetical protein